MSNVLIKKGLSDYQIIQHKKGFGELELKGEFIGEGQVYARVMSELDFSTVVNYTKATQMGQNWEITLKIPVGGPYRLETSICRSKDSMPEWYQKGDMRHNIGVGDIYVIAGQSNASGYGKNPAYDPPQIGVHMFKKSGKWDLATHPLSDATDAIYGALEGANGGTSPYLTFAKDLQNKLGYPIGLVPTALGGSALSQWHYETGAEYKNMINVLKAVGKIKGMLWYQGCSDADREGYKDYLERFKEFVYHVREDLNNDLPVLTCQLNMCYTDTYSTPCDIGWAGVREAQRQAAMQIKDVYVMSTTDLGFSDEIHNSSDGNVTLGHRLAKLALSNIYNNGKYQTPSLKSIKKQSALSLKITFDNVEQYLRSYYSDFSPFDVEDNGEFIKIVSTIVDKNYVLLKLEKKISDNAVVHCGWQKNLLVKPPVDYTTQTPVLSFYNAKID